METQIASNGRLEKLAGILGFTVIALFGIFIAYTGKLEGVSMVSFAMWCCLDILLWVIAKRRGEVPLLIIGWTVSTIGVTVLFAILGASWHIGTPEVVAMLCVAIAAGGLWYWQKDAKASYAGGIALYLSGIPQTILAYQNPLPETWWFWLMATAATGLSLYAKRGGGKESLFAERLIVFSQATIFLLTVR